MILACFAEAFSSGSHIRSTWTERLKSHTVSASLCSKAFMLARPRSCVVRSIHLIGFIALFTAAIEHSFFGGRMSPNGALRGRKAAWNMSTFMKEMHHVYLLDLHPLAPPLRLNRHIRCVVALPAFHVVSDLRQKSRWGCMLDKGTVVASNGTQHNQVQRTTILPLWHLPGVTNTY